MAISQASYRWLHLMMLCIVLVALTNYYNAPSLYRVIDRSSELERLDYYCNNDAAEDSRYLSPPWLTAKGSHPFDGENAPFASSTGGGTWELDKLVIAIRHGDRSSIHHIPNSEPIYNIGGPGSYYDESVVDTADEIFSEHFSVNILEGEQMTPEEKVRSVEGEAGGFNLLSLLGQRPLFPKNEEALAPGLLTTKGFAQQLTVGKRMSRTYKKFLAAYVGDAGDIYIRSTNYQRTVLSAVGMLFGLLGGLLPGMKDHGSGRLRIDVLANEAKETMHGVGERYSSHTIDPILGEKRIVGGCPKSADFAKQQRLSFVPSHVVTGAVEEAYTGSMSTKPAPRVTELADAMLPCKCHSSPYPRPLSSTVNHSSHPTGESLLAAVMSEADRYFCQRYAGDRGGREATYLSIYPFLLELYLHIAGVSTSTDGSVPVVHGSGESGVGVRLSVFSGHDTVIAPVLAGLGLYGAPELGLCNWPRYASHIIFEKWVHMGDKVGVKVVYNGFDLTEHIPTCQAATMREGRRTESPCPLHVFKEQIDSLLMGQSSFEDSCAS